MGALTPARPMASSAGAVTSITGRAATAPGLPYRHTVLTPASATPHITLRCEHEVGVVDEVPQGVRMLLQVLQFGDHLLAQHLEVGGREVAQPSVLGPTPHQLV